MSVFGHASINFCFSSEYINLTRGGAERDTIFIGGKSNERAPRPTTLVRGTGALPSKLFDLWFLYDRGAKKYETRLR